jgi:hypothetical protein
VSPIVIAPSPLEVTEMIVPVGTPTPDLYRIKGQLTNTYNNLDGFERKHREIRLRRNFRFDLENDTIVHPSRLFATL